MNEWIINNKPLLMYLNRRKYLIGLTTITGTAVAGCTRRLDDNRSRPNDERTAPRIDRAWPIEGYDLGNTRNTDSRGPAGEMNILWENETESRGDPIVDDSLVYTSVNSTVRAREATTGEWVKAPINGANGEVRTIINDAALLSRYSNNELHIVCLSIENGSERWTTVVEGDHIEGFAADDSRVYVLNLGSSAEGYRQELTCLSARSGRKQWHKSLQVAGGSDGRFIPHFGLAYIDDLLAVTTGDRLIARDLKDGEVLWTDPLGAFDSPLTVGPVGIANKVIIGTESNTIVAFNTSGELEWQADTASRANELAIGDEYVYAATDGIEKFELGTGMSDNLSSSLPDQHVTLADKTLYSTGGGDLTAIDVETNEELATVSVETETVEDEHGYSAETLALHNITAVDDLLFVRRPNMTDGSATIVAIGPGADQ